MNLDIAGENGFIHRYDGSSIKVIKRFNSNETMMGMSIHNDKIWYAGKTTIYKENEVFIRVGKKDIHQIQIADDRLHVVSTFTNEIGIYDISKGRLVRIVAVKPPIANSPVKYKENYNHINNVFKDNRKWYVNLNWFNKNQYGSSGVAVFNEKFEETGRFKYGWESHGYCIIGNEPWALVGSSKGIHKINHEDTGGLMIGGFMAWSHDTKWFCKDFSVDDNCVYIVGTSKAVRKDRNNSEGVLFILDRKDYSQIDEIVMEKKGGFCGCLSQPVDYTKNQ